MLKFVTALAGMLVLLLVFCAQHVQHASNRSIATRPAVNAKRPGISLFGSMMCKVHPSSECSKVQMRSDADQGGILPRSLRPRESEAGIAEEHEFHSLKEDAGRIPIIIWFE